MPKTDPRVMRRSLLTFTGQEIDQLRTEASKKGLPLALYLKMLVTTHPERADVVTKRAASR